MTANAHRPPPPCDAGKLEQMLRVEESLLLGELPTAELPGRICQAATLLVGASACRLALPGGNGAVVVLAQYGDVDFAVLDAVPAGRHIVAGGMALDHTADGRTALSIPIAAGEGSPVLQLLGTPHLPFTPEQVGLARHATTLATVALRHAGQRERLERSSSTKSEVLVAVSHDLRTPLNVLIGYTRLLIEEAYGPCTAEQRDVLQTVERHALELLSVLSGALDLVRLELQHGELRRDEFTLRDLVAELCTGSLAHRVASGVRLAWRVDPRLPPLRTDRFRVRQILQNLVDNALRFTTTGDVSVEAAPHGDGVRLTVSDTGPGIATGELPHLFELFRSGTGDASRRSTGCGLYLVKRFSESLGGRVAVESAPGRGTRFVVDLPLAL